MRRLATPTSTLSLVSTAIVPPACGKTPMGGAPPPPAVPRVIHTLPQPAVGRDGVGKPLACMEDAAGNFEQRAPVTDRAIGDQWLLRGGLKAGDRLCDRLVVSGQQKAGPGAPSGIVAPRRTLAAAGAPNTKM